MFDGSSMRGVREAVASLAAGFDASLLTPRAAQRFVEHAAATENMLAAMKAAAAQRVAGSELWRREGDLSPAHHLARTSGSSVSKAREALDIASRREKLPELDAALRRGELSPAQAAPIADAATKDPRAEARLVAKATRCSVGELVDECARTKAAAEPDPDALHKALHAARFLRRRRCADGSWELSYRSTVDEVTEVWSMAKGHAARIFRRARAEGRREPEEAYLADGLLATARAAAAAAAAAARRAAGASGPGETSQAAAGDDGGTEAARAPGQDEGATGTEAAGATPVQAATGTGTAGAPGEAQAATGTAAPPGRGECASGAPGANNAGAPAGAGPGPDRPPPPGQQPLWGRPETGPGPPAPAPATAAPGDLEPEPPPVRPDKVVVRIDWDALIRGWPIGEEVSEIAGVGFVPPSLVQGLIDSGDVFLAAVVTKGTDIVNVAHLGRRPTAAQVTALQWRDPTCTAEGCNRSVRLEMDHRKDWASSKVTLLGWLDRLCAYHHDLKTHKGWAFVPGVGKRAMVAPGDVRHPRQATAG